MNTRYCILDFGGSATLNGKSILESKPPKLFSGGDQPVHVNINFMEYVFELCWWNMVVNGGAGRAFS